MRHELRRRHSHGRHEQGRERTLRRSLHQDALRLRTAAGAGRDGLLRHGHVRPSPPRAGGGGVPSAGEPPEGRNRTRPQARRARLRRLRAPRPADVRVDYGQQGRLLLPAPGKVFVQPQAQQRLSAPSHEGLPLEHGGVLDGDGRDGGGLAVRAGPVRVRLAGRRAGLRARRRRRGPPDLRPVRLHGHAHELPGSGGARPRRRVGRHVQDARRRLVAPQAHDGRQRLVRARPFGLPHQHGLLHARARGDPRGTRAAVARRQRGGNGAGLRAGVRSVKPRLHLRGRVRPRVEPEHLLRPAARQRGRVFHERPGLRIRRQFNQHLRIGHLRGEREGEPQDRGLVEHHDPA